MRRALVLVDKGPNTGSVCPGCDGGQHLGEKLLQPRAIGKRRADGASGINSKPSPQPEALQSPALLTTHLYQL